ncbi:lipopolysaccharide biosynthesis protein [Microvirga sp. KLBC 81]|uniref:lipopolysaccharide biosynthesis protein n=1 Tax=Microvirga sp. KLBC 81 TaxID=1862707 RepID=UPI000D50747E|nr:lipopolysaccharide biosynthesis protein [Microvirga sp. KLBC 81]PVE21060.1 lipopolysaccharide biosynthesis protein [Microvirga sp. KLBC 81]
MSSTHNAQDPREHSSAGSRSLTEHTLHGVFWVFAGTTAQSLLKVSVTIVLARLLSPIEFGIVGAALVIVGFCQIISQLGVGPAVVQRHDLTDGHVKAAFCISVTMGICIGLLVYFAAGSISAFFRIPELEQVVRVLAFLFPIASLGVVAEGVLQKNMRFKQLSGIEVFSYAAGYGLVGIVCALAGLGIWALVIAQLAQISLQAGFLLKFGSHPKGIRFDKRAVGQLLHFGTGFSLAKVGNAIAIQADNLVVGRWLGAEALGSYGRAYQFMMLPTNLFGKVVDSVLFPSMASVQNDPERLGRAYLTSVGLVAMVTIPLSGLLTILAPEIVVTLLGAQWSGVIAPFQILTIVLVFRTSYKMSDTLVRAKGAVYNRAWRQWIYAILVFIGAYLGTFAGLRGVAVGTGLAIILNFLLMLDLSIKLTNVSWMSFARVFARHTLISLPILAGSWAFVLYARHYGIPSVLVISGTLLGSAIAFLGWFILFPGTFGDEGRFAMQIIGKHLPRGRFPFPKQRPALEPLPSAASPGVPRIGDE